MNPTDIEIRKRLDKLKDDRPPVPSEEELCIRLQKLKGDKQKPSTALDNKYVLLPCAKSNEEQVNDVMKQYSDEVTLQKRFTTPVNDIEERLNNLKMSQFSNSDSSVRGELLAIECTNTQVTNMTETERRSRSMKEHISLGFDKEVEAMTTDQDESLGCSSSYPQEYFCYICDRVPKWICYTCDDLLFCPACFEQYHEDEDEPHKKRSFNVRRMHLDSDSD